MVFNLSENHSILNEWVSDIRNIHMQNDRLRFRKNLERIGFFAGIEISKTLDFETANVTTPLGSIDMPSLSSQPVIATILRAGVPMHHGLMEVFDKADAAFIAAFRKHHKDGSFEIEQNYITSPGLTDRPLIIADPMLATGASLSLAINSLLNLGKPSSVHIVSAIASVVGVEYIQRKHPDVNIWVAAIDDEITAKGYIVPGLGDAGDLSYGSKMQN